MGLKSNSIIPSLNLFDISVDRRLSLLHTKAYIISEELAEEGLEKLLLPLIRYRELRGTSLILISRGSAKDYMEKNKPLLELSPTKQFELIRALTGSHGLYSSTLFQHFYNDLKSLAVEGTVPLVAIQNSDPETAQTAAEEGVSNLTPGDYVAGEVPITGGNPVQIIGSAVFRGDRMVGSIGGEETRYLLMLQGRFGRGKLTVTDPLAGKPASVDFDVKQARRSKIKTRIDPEGNVAIDVDIFLEPEIIGINSGVNYESKENKAILEEAFSYEIQRGCQELIRRTQEEFRSDIIGFGNKVRRHFWTSSPWEEFHWLERYPEAEVNVTVHSRIRRTGLLLKTTPSRGGE
ncbi:MAG: hypothetical protein BWY80_00338 [Firmicutes bacterium ADurb.Bin456]|nr:MAG: hypothetical protein BWY80_00338 [Firmicutes bacterium ADurb.Bin456]